MNKRILVPLDGSPQAEDVLRFGSFLPINRFTTVVLLRVAEYPYDLFSTLISEYPPTDPALSEQIRAGKRQIQDSITTYLDRVAERLKRIEVDSITAVGECPVVGAILEAAERFRVDMIVMSAHGLGGYAAQGLGAVTSRVLNESTVPVAIIQPRPAIQVARNLLSPAIAERARVYIPGDEVSSPVGSLVAS